LPGPNGTCSFTDQGKAISKFLLDAWTNMAALQKPTANASEWPAWTGPWLSKGLVIADSPLPSYINFTICELMDPINGQFVAEGNSNKSSASN